MVDRQKLQVDLAHKDFYRDFNLQYMWQRTDPTQFRAYYMLTFGVRVPIYRKRKQRPELAQAEVELSRSRSEVDAQTQQVAAQLRNAYDTAQKTADLLKIYREGLIPQARAGFQAGIAGGETVRVFSAVPKSWRSVWKRVVTTFRRARSKLGWNSIFPAW
jgi:outer membrane protein TolC